MSEQTAASSVPGTAADLAQRCVDAATRHVEALLGAHAPGLRLPRVFAGHVVGPDVRADLCFTLGMLAECGVVEVAGHDIRTALASLLSEVDGRRTHTFYSYRIAETLLRLEVTTPIEAHLAEACDSTAAIPGLDEGTLPRNYAAVLARCEVARSRLGLIGDDDPVLRDLVERTRLLLGSNPRGYLDDSRSDIARYDIYTADIYLFTEPFADLLGAVWERGAAAAVDLVERVGAGNGAGFSWGRSTGALGVALTVELAGLVTRHGLGADQGAWLARGTNALDHLDTWFSPEDGVIRAHQHRSTFDYRGPFRRLQMTLDCLGKLVDAALSLGAAPATKAAPLEAAFPDRDELIELDADRRAAVWSYRSDQLAFTLPLVGATGSDYLAGPRNPGLFETPVDSGLVVALPYAVRSGRSFAPALPPSEVAHEGGALTAVHDIFHLTGQLELAPDAPTLEGASRHARYTVDGRTLHVDEHLRFEGKLPHAVAVQVAEAAGRPLRFHVAGGGAQVVRTRIDTAGIKEWRSFWGELPVVHQADIEPAAELRFAWSVTPKLRVLTTAHEHHYHRALYDPLQDDVVDARFPTGRMNDLAALRAALDACDIFHLHWPEWLFGPDLARHRLLIEELRRARVRIVWTQHNFGPHDRDARVGPAYELWAEAADAVLHHSRWGQEQVTATYRYRPDAIHAVIPHPHFGHLSRRSASDRARVEAELGLSAGKLRLGVVGAPRPGKDVELAMRAVSRSARDDIELVVFSLRGGEHVPDDPRVIAQRYEMVPRELYEARLSAIDVLILPFDPGAMLTTGTVGDVVAHGIPALVSSWPFLAEALGEAGIEYGTTEDDLLQAIDGLDDERLARAAAASAGLAPACASETVAAELLAVLERVGTSKL